MSEAPELLKEKEMQAGGARYNNAIANFWK